jgi:hypothetical protein
VRASANVTACKSQIARVRAQVAAEYLSFYDNELLPFLRGIADEASVSVRAEFSDSVFEQKVRKAATRAAEDARSEMLSGHRRAGASDASAPELGAARGPKGFATV